METYRVSFVGHRKIYQIRKIEEFLHRYIYDLLSKKEYVEFYVGRNGDFDVIVASVIKNVQSSFGKHNSSLILVLPYHSKDEDYYADFYDEIYLPIDETTHFKAAISKRNEWMIDNSDLLISYVENMHGGAYTAQKYAKQKGIETINISHI